MNRREIVNQYKDRKILITGGAGCIGSNLIRTLLKANPENIVVIDDLSSSFEWNLPEDSRIDFVKCDILDEEKVEQAFSTRPDFVFHLAAHFANQNSVEHPEKDLMVNGLGTLRMLEYSNSVGVKRFVYASSGCSVYGSQAPLPLKESHVSLHLDTPYQLNKLVGELYCNFFNDYYGLQVAIARFFNVYGPGEVPGRYRNVIPNFLWWAMNKQPLPITGTGEETRDFTYVGDIVDGTLRLGVVGEAVGEAVNLASEKETRIIDLAKLIVEITGNNVDIVFKKKRDWDKSFRRRASIEKAKNILGYEPIMDLKVGIENTHKWITDNWENINACAKF
ncbi:MAG: NAD-dependent epimerase/dehydratase family protein [Candidatus Bathyarchaeota archaeon]|nr:NAD-dependent epimerase/dehydratase family protein [Candidatus Bathyarchaeota archaeon]